MWYYREVMDGIGRAIDAVGVIEREKKR